MGPKQGGCGSETESLGGFTVHVFVARADVARPRGDNSAAADGALDRPHAEQSSPLATMPRHGECGGDR
jgi:hypothetical protein